MLEHRQVLSDIGLNTQHLKSPKPQIQLQGSATETQSREGIAGPTLWHAKILSFDQESYSRAALQ